MECTGCINPAPSDFTYKVVHSVQYTPLLSVLASNPDECWKTSFNLKDSPYAQRISKTDLDFLSCIPHKSPSSVPQMKAFSLEEAISNLVHFLAKHFEMIHNSTFHPSCYLLLVQQAGMFLPLQVAATRRIPSRLSSTFSR